MNENKKKLILPGYGATNLLSSRASNPGHKLMAVHLQ